MEPMDTLRAELIESQKARMDLMKWKLILIAIIGGAGLGLSGGAPNTASANAPLSLAVLPIACLYVDLLCRHLSLRNKAIGRFIESAPHDSPVLRQYERYYATVSLEAGGGMSFESIALRGCTTFVSLAIIPLGILASGFTLGPGGKIWPTALFVLSGLGGVLLSAVLERLYQKAKRVLESLSASAA
jgi:hypothetical protein